jgi:hypothetical protein
MTAIDRDQALAALDPAIEYLTGEYGEDFPMVERLVKLRAALPAIPLDDPEKLLREYAAPIEAENERLQGLVNKWATNWCPKCNAHMELRGALPVLETKKETK